MEISFFYHSGLSGHQLSLVAPCLDVEILPLVFLIFTHLKSRNYSKFFENEIRIHEHVYLFDSLLDDGSEVLDDGEMLNNLGHYNQTVPDLHEVLALETHNQGLRNFVMPFVTHVSARKCMCYIVTCYYSIMFRRLT